LKVVLEAEPAVATHEPLAEPVGAAV